MVALGGWILEGEKGEILTIRFSCSGVSSVRVGRASGGGGVEGRSSGMISKVFGEFVWLGGVKDEFEEQLLVSEAEPLLWRLIDNECHVAIETRLVLIWGGLGGLSRD